MASELPEINQNLKVFGKGKHLIRILTRKFSKKKNSYYNRQKGPIDLIGNLYDREKHKILSYRVISNQDKYFKIIKIGLSSFRSEDGTVYKQQ